MEKKIWIVMCSGEGEHNFGVLNEPVYSEKEAAELIAKDIISGTEEELDLKTLTSDLTGDYEVDRRDYGYDCDYNIESFTIEF